MKCPSCGAEVPAGGLFCVSCGAMVSGGSTPSPQQDAAQQNSQQYENTQQGYQQFETPQPSYQQYEAPQQPNYQQYDNSQVQTGPTYPQGPDQSYQAGPNQGYQQNMGPQYQQGMNPQFQQGYAAPMPQGQAGMIFSDTFRLFVESITSPVTAYRSVIDQNRFVQGILLIVLEALLAFFTFLIHLPIGSVSKYVAEVLNANVRAKIGGMVILVILFVVVLTAVAALIFRDKFVQGYTFLSLLGMFGTATVYGSLGFLVVFFFGVFSPLIAGTIAACMVTVWFGQSFMILHEVIGGDENTKAVRSIISIAAVTFIFIIMAYMLVKNGVVSSLDSLTDWL